MMALAPYPDIEDAISDFLVDLGQTGTYKPDDLTAVIKGDGVFHLVYRFAGADDGITDVPLIGIDTFASKRSTGWAAAELVRQRMTAAPHTINGDIVIDTVRTSEAPHEVPWGDSSVRRWVSSYFVSYRR